MTEAQIALARRAVAAPGWRWMRGMRIADTKFARVVAVRDSGPCGAEEGPTGDDNAAVWLDDWTTATLLPDLSDPLTALGLLALVRERWGPMSCVVWDRDRKMWAVYSHMAMMVEEVWQPVAVGATEVEALVVALEVTP